MSRIWFTSDLHIGHRIAARDRGFGDDVADHDAWIADLWRSAVRKNDTVYVLGDIAVSRFSHVLPWIAALPGQKHLVAGNHDPIHPMHGNEYARWSRLFGDTFASFQPFRRLRIGGREVALSHFPYEEHGDGYDRPGSRHNQWRLPDMGMALLHGHTHGQERAHGHSLHVGIDAWRALVPHAHVEDWARGLPEADETA